MNEELKPGIYQHFKGQKYQVFFVATDSETEQKMVVYKALYGEEGMWVRPLNMFSEWIERDGKKQQRFSYLGPAE